MALVPLQRKPRNDLATLHSDMDDLFDSFFRGLDRPFGGYKAWPAIDVSEKDDSLLVRAEVPGCKAEDIEISVYDNVLTISGEKKQQQEKKEKGCHYVESNYGTFRRQINLPSDVDPQKVEAACNDGVLSITLPKAEKARAVKIKVKG